MNLKTRLKDADRQLKMYASRLERLNIETFEDLLHHFPFRYEDYSLISEISNVQPGEMVTIQGKILEIKNNYTRRFKTIQRATITDDTGNIDVIWFNQPFLTRIMQKNDTVSLSGKVGEFQRKPVLEVPEYEVITSGSKTIHTGRLVPIYPETRGVSSKWLRRQIYKLIKEFKEELIEYLPEKTLQEQNLVSYQTAIEQIHFPDTHQSSQNARERLAFDELLIMHMESIMRKAAWEKNLSGNSFSISKFKAQIEAFWKRLPFELTNAQKRAVREIFADLAQQRPMNRLLEGDVGSGKTVVSAIAMYLAHLNGFQSVLMAPTEILANQHFRTITDLLSPFNVQVGISTRSKKIGSSKFDILIGTHAVLSEKLQFNSLGLVVIDEQQRFGVSQRAIIRQKGKNPHLLTMTATPIPRTVALARYGDLNLSFLDEMPKGRKLIKTWLVPKEKRDAAYRWIEAQLKKTGSQIFIICPFIEESESMQTIKAAKVEFERLKKEIFPNLRLGLLHGKLKAKEKDTVLQEFRDKKIDILVATPVVEVGIDFPNATIILIEASDRFGLAQLHQLRGRVGRGEDQSYCLLFTESISDQTTQRLKAMETMHVGAELAELDLKLRGPGELYGTMQHGVPMLKVARFSDLSLIQRARKEAEKLFSQLNKHTKLQEKIKTIESKEVSPD